MLRTETEEAVTALMTETDVEDTPDTPHRSNESGLALNQDCWLTVIDFLFGEFQTLSRLMLVSRSLSRLAVKHLYGQLGHPDNDRTIENWSLKKQHRLFALLLSSSGLNIAKKDVQAFLEKDSIELDWPPIEVYEQKPLAFDYFGVMKRFPNNLMELFKSWMEHDGKFSGDETAIRRLCSILTTLSLFDHDTLERLRPWIESLGQVSVLKLVSISNVLPLFKEKTIEFVLRHNASYPGKLTDVYCNNLDHGFLIELMKIIQPTKLFVIEKFDITSISMSDEVGWLKNLKAFEFRCDIEVASLLALISSLDKLLNYSRQLESVKLLAGDDSFINSDDLLAWAPKELVDSQVFETESLASFLPQSHSPLTSSVSIEPRFLVPVKVFHGTNVSESILSKVIDGFRNSLQEIVFSGTFTLMNATKDWSWPLSRLTSLKLSFLRMSMSKFKLFPVLENLCLVDVIACKEADNGQSDSLWSVPPLVKRLTLVGVFTFASLDPESVGQLYRLEYLTLKYRDCASPCIRFNTSNNNTQPWFLPRLKFVILYSDANLVWQRRLLESSPNLKGFSTPHHIMDFPNSWWNEEQEYIEGIKDVGVAEKKEASIKMRTQGRQPIKNKFKTEPLLMTQNAQETKIKSLWFGGTDWKTSQVNGFAHLLQQPLPTLVQNQQRFSTDATLSAAAATSTMGRANWIAFPDLVVVKLEHLARSGLVKNEQFPYFDNLLMVLMTRPKMRLVLTVFWKPTEKLIKSRLQQLSDYDCPKRIEKFGEDQYGIYLTEGDNDRWCQGHSSDETSADVMDPSKPCLLNCRLEFDEFETYTYVLKKKV